MDTAENKILVTETRTCINCGDTFVLTPALQQFYIKKGYELPKRCEACRKKKEEILTVKCVDCGKEFQINGYQRDYFTKKGLELPKRCESCREIKRERNKELMLRSKNTQT